MAKPAPPSDPQGVDAFIAKWPPRVQAQLTTLRKTLMAAIPDATEHLSYATPAIRSGGKFCIYYGAAAHHTTLHAMGSKVFDDHPGWTQGYTLGKGSIQFPHDQPIPVALVKRIAKARVADLAAGVPSHQARRQAVRRPARATAAKAPAAKPAAARTGAPRFALPKLGAPATKALASIGVTDLRGVAQHSRQALLALHGVGPKAMDILDDSVQEAGLAFRRD